jgi:hypothetical protein
MLIDRTTVFCLSQDTTSSNNTECYSYFINWKTKFKTISIALDDDELYHPVTGLYVNGPNAWFDSVAGHMRSANYVKGWEKPIHIEFFDANGTRLDAQNAGISIFGGNTRFYPEKSLRVIARKKYDDSRFDFDVFGLGKKKYKHLVLRHSGNDYRQTRFKDAFATTVARKSGLDVQANCGAHLFVNAEYWGVYNIREKINARFLAQNHQIPEEGIDLIQGYKTIEEGSAMYYDYLLQFVTENDLANPENYLVLDALMDRENFANFWIHQLFYANNDARGNIRFWRSDYYDGRFRWIVYDTDLGLFAGKNAHNTIGKFTSDTQTEWYNPEWATLLLRKLLLNNEFRNYFINQACYLIGTTLSETELLQEINSFEERYRPEMELHFGKRKRFQEYQGSMHKWQQHVNELKQFCSSRQPYFLSHLKQKFDLDSTFQLKLDIKGWANGKVTLNGNVLLDSLLEATFFSAVPVPVSASPSLGFSLSSEVPKLIHSSMKDTLLLTIQFVENPKSDRILGFTEFDFERDAIELEILDSITTCLNGWHLKTGSSEFTIHSEITSSDVVVLANLTPTSTFQNRETLVPFNIKAKQKIELYDDAERLVCSIELPQKLKTRFYSLETRTDSLGARIQEWKFVESPSIGTGNYKVKIGSETNAAALPITIILTILVSLISVMLLIVRLKNRK